MGPRNAVNFCVNQAKPRCIHFLEKRATAFDESFADVPHPSYIDRMGCAASHPTETSHPLTHKAATLASTLPVGPLEVPGVDIRTCPVPSFSTEAYVASPSSIATTLTFTRATFVVKRPLEVKFTCIGLQSGTRVPRSITRVLSINAIITIAVEPTDQTRTSCVLSVPVSARPAGDGCIVRILVRPELWADADSVTVVSLTLAGRPFSCDSLPATVPVDYNHRKAPEGAITMAAKAGDIPALTLALRAGESTEESDEVGVLGV